MGKGQNHSRFPRNSHQTDTHFTQPWHYHQVHSPAISFFKKKKKTHNYFQGSCKNKTQAELSLQILWKEKSTTWLCCSKKEMLHSVHWVTHLLDCWRSSEILTEVQGAFLPPHLRPYQVRDLFIDLLMVIHSTRRRKLDEGDPVNGGAYFHLHVL